MPTKYLPQILRPLARGAGFVALIACVTPDEPGLSSTVEELTADNGTQLNGIQLNGIQLNGIQLNGIQLNGIQLNGIQLNGTTLSGTLAGVTKSGTQLVGATMTGTLSTGATIALRFDAIAALPAPNSDVLAHVVSYKGSGPWTPLCGVDGAGPIAAIPLAGTWNLGEGVTGGGSWTNTSGMFTLACRGAALAKCVEMGYKPWSSKSGTSLRNHHQACTRMVRGDYCGDGRPGTIDGWSINVYDGIGIQARATGTRYTFDATWSATGAACLTESRLRDLGAVGDVPACLASKLSATCESTSFTSSSRIIKTEQDASGLVRLVNRLADAKAGTPLGDSAANVLVLVDDARAALDLSPPDRVSAVGYLEGGVGELDAAVTSSVLASAYGNQLANRFTGLGRRLAVTTRTANACSAQYSSKLSQADTALAQGDTHRSAGRYKDAVNAYKAATTLARDANGSPCSGGDD